MRYLGKLTEDNQLDIWFAATEPSFQAYNKPDQSPELQYTFVRSLKDHQRNALVTILVENEIPSGGIYGLVSCMGLLVSEINEALSFYGADEYLKIPMIEYLEFGGFPQDYDSLMNKWDIYADKHAELIEKAGIDYWELSKEDALRNLVEKNIKENMGSYFENV